jgi:glycosyltransferase involved in cell wall biosynthesis
VADDPFFRQSLQSILNQTYQNLEILVADDASTDDTADMVRAFSDSNPVSPQREQPF